MGFLGKLFGRSGGGEEERKDEAEATPDAPPMSATTPMASPDAQTPIAERPAAVTDARRPAPAAPKVEPGRRACAECGRVLLSGSVDCPFCKPQQFEEDLESTVHRDYKPQQGVVLMAGVVTATELARQHGASGFLHVYEGANRGLSVLLGDRTVSMGRGTGNTLALNDGGVSTKHAEIRPNLNGFALVDAGSKNGTFVNDRRVKDRQLSNGDIIALGATRIYIGILRG